MVRIRAEWEKPLVRPVLVVFGVIMLGMWAMLRANFYYVDDLARTVEGYKGWGNFSRYLSNLLAMFVNGNGTLTDISPWPQILAALILAVAGVLLLYIIYGRKKFRWWELLAVVMLVLNPYFLQCLSYKFDAPYIAVAVLMMIVPFLWRGKKSGWYVLAVTAGTLMTCMTYQAALGILPMITVILAVRMWNRGEKWGEIWRFIVKTVVGYVIALVIFRLGIMRNVDAYVVTTLPSAGELLPKVLENLKSYYSLMINDFATTWLVLIGLIVLAFVVMMVMKSKQNRLLAGFVAVVTVGVLSVLCFGIYVVMEVPLFEPRAMFGSMVMITLLAICVVEDVKMKPKWVLAGGVAVTMGLVYLFGIFGLTYGNALALQKEWTDFQIEGVAEDLGELVGEGDTILIAGTAGLAPAIETAVREYPVVGRLVPVEFENGYWGQYKLLRYYDLLEYEGDFDIVPEVDEYEIVKQSEYYNLRRKGKEVVVELKG